DPLLDRRRQMERHQLRDVERIEAELLEVLEIQHQDAEQHQHAAHQRVQEEFDCGVKAPRATPNADDEVHRHQDHFEEDVEQEEIERDENADHARLQQQKKRVEFLHPL